MYNLIKKVSKTWLKIALTGIFAFVATVSFGQVGKYEPNLHARDTLETDQRFMVARDTVVPILDVSYHEWSADASTWRDEYVLGDRYLRISNDVENTWVEIDLYDRYWVLGTDSAIYVNTDYANRILIDTTTAPSNFKVFTTGDVGADYYFLGTDSLTHTNMYNGGAVDGYTLVASGDTAIWQPAASGVGETNLTYSAYPDSGRVNSDTGTDAVIQAGSTVNASLMLPTDKTKLDGLDEVSITGGGINVVSGTYPNFTVTGTEVDGSAANEVNTAANYDPGTGIFSITDDYGIVSDTIEIDAGDVTNLSQFILNSVEAADTINFKFITINDTSIANYVINVIEGGSSTDIVLVQNLTDASYDVNFNSIQINDTSIVNYIIEHTDASSFTINDNNNYFTSTTIEGALTELYNISISDADSTNEGSLTVTSGGTNIALINSNTAGSTPVAIQAAGDNTLSIVGNAITLTGGSGTHDSIYVENQSEWVSDGDTILSTNLKAMVVNQNEDDSIGYWIHTSEIVNDTLFLIQYAYDKNIFKFNDLDDLTDYTTTTYSADILGTSCYSEITDKIYAGGLINDTVVIVEINPHSLDINYHKTNIKNNASSSPPIVTDGSYIYGATYGATTSTFFKIDISTWNTVATNTWIESGNSHAAEINISRNQFYVSSISGWGRFAIVSTTDLSYTHLDNLYLHGVSEFTDDLAYYDNGDSCFVFIGGEVGGSLKINITNGNKVSYIPTYPSFGLFEHNGIIYNAAYINNCIQEFSVFNTDEINTYDLKNRSYLDEFLITSTNRLFATRWGIGHGSGIMEISIPSLNEISASTISGGTNQTLSTSGAAGNISISDGNTINLNVNDADASATNELPLAAPNGGTRITSNRYVGLSLTNTNELTTSLTRLSWLQGWNVVSNDSLHAFRISELDGLIEPNEGDKGDITVSGSGATWNIDAGVVGATELASTAVSAGSYTNSNITVDADGRITAASSGTVPITQETDAGAKTGDISFDASTNSIGAYTLSTTSSVNVKINNLTPSTSTSYQGTVYIQIGASNPAAITVSTYSDAGTTGLTEVALNSQPTLTAGDHLTITYTAVNNGTSTIVYIVYGKNV